MAGYRVAAAVIVAAVFAAGCSQEGKSSSRAAAPSSSSTTTSTTVLPTTVPPTKPTNPSLRGVPGSDVPLPQLPNGGISHVPSSIASNCADDVTSRLQSWINATPNNSTLVFPAGACYRIDETLVLQNRDRLRIEGNGATLRAVTTGTRTRAHLVMKDSTDIIVQDLVVRGANPHAGATVEAYKPKLEAQHAFQVSGSTGVLLDRVQAYDVFGDFVYIGAANSHPSENVTVEHAFFQRSGRQGISITGGVNVTVADSMFGGAARSLVDLEANTPSTPIRNIAFLRNTTGAARNFWLADKGADASIGDISFIDNHMIGDTRGLVFVYSKGAVTRGPYLFQGNQLIAQDLVHDEGSRGAFFFANAKDVTIRDNTVRFAAGMPAIELRNAHDVSVRSNHFTGQGTVLLPTAGSSDYHVS